MKVFGFYKLGGTEDPKIVGTGPTTTMILCGGWQAKRGLPWTNMNAVMVGWNRVQKFKDRLHPGMTIYLEGKIGSGKLDKKPTIYVENLTFSDMDSKSAYVPISEPKQPEPPKTQKFKRLPPSEN